MTTGMERHRHADDHEHMHGPDCGHETVKHGDHVDGHCHAARAGHYDEHDAASGAGAPDGG